MNSLKTIDNSISPVLTPSEVEMVKAAQNKKIRETSERDVAEWVMSLIPRTYFEAGQKIDNMDLLPMVEIFCEELFKYFGTLTLSEVSIAFRNGVRRVYGENMGLNVVSFGRWVSGYMISQSRQESIKKQQKWLSKEKDVELTQQQKDEILAKGLEEAMRIYAEKGQYFDVGNALYNYADRIGLIKFSTYEKKEFCRMAQEHLRNSVSLKDTVGMYERDRVREFLMTIEDNKSSEVVVEAKRIAFNEWLKNNKK